MRQPKSLIVKDPTAIEPYGFDWTAWLAELGASVTITSSGYTVADGSDAALTLADASVIAGNLKTQVRLVGGTRGVKYRVNNHIVASSGDADTRSFFVLVNGR